MVAEQMYGLTGEGGVWCTAQERMGGGMMYCPGEKGGGYSLSPE